MPDQQKPIHIIVDTRELNGTLVKHWQAYAGNFPGLQHEARELGREQLRRLEVHVRVDEAGDDVRAVRVERLDPLVGAEPGDDAVADRDVDVEPLAREDAQHTAAADDEVGRLVAPRDRETPLQEIRVEVDTEV